MIIRLGIYEKFKRVKILEIYVVYVQSKIWIKFSPLSFIFIIVRTKICKYENELNVSIDFNFAFQSTTLHRI